MLTVALVLGGTFLYCVIGRAFGDMVIGEMLNWKPFYKLGFWGKLKRTLLFPISRRNEINSSKIYLPSYTFFLNTHLIYEGKRPISIKPKYLRNYNAFSTWLGVPFRLLNFLTGIVVFVGVDVFGNVHRPIEIVLKLVRACLRKMRKQDRLSVWKEKLEELRVFEQEKLAAALSAVQSIYQRLQENFKFLSGKADDVRRILDERRVQGGFEFRCRDLLNILNNKRRETASSLRSAQITLSEVQSKRAELNDFILLVEIQVDITDRDVQEHAEKTLEAALSLREGCAEVLQSAYELERDVLASTSASAEELADHVLEEGEHVAAVLQSSTSVKDST